MRYETRAIRTDIASESCEDNCDIDGVDIATSNPQADIQITRVRIKTKEAAQILEKDVGKYITIDAPGLAENDPDYAQIVENIFAEELKSLCGSLGKHDTILVAGLGNRSITPDALGPEVSARVLVSRHVTEYLPIQIDERVRPVCAFAPGVLGVTGIETGEVVLGVVNRVAPSLVIAVDALASRSTDRLSTSIQLTDTGVSPGSGLGNNRMKLTKETIGVPVIGIGVPTVVYASTISQDAVALLLSEMGEDGDKAQQLLTMVGKVVSERIGPLVVTPKDIDSVIDRSAALLAAGIDMALHGMSQDEVKRFLS